MRYLLIIFFSLVSFFISPSVFAEGVAVPSPNCLGNTSCETTPTPTISTNQISTSPSNSVSNQPSLAPSSSPSGNPSPTSSPCSTSQSSVSSQSSGATSSLNYHHKGRGGNKWHGSAGDGFLQQFMQFLLQLLQQLFQKLDINLPIPTSGCPSPSASPTSGGNGGGSNPSIAPSSQPSTGVITTPTIFGQPSSAPSSPPSSAAPSQAPTGTTSSVKPVGNIPGNWTLKFDDEFSGTSVDTTKWNVEGPKAPNNSQEEDCYAPSAVSESGGYLNIALSNTSCTVGGTSYKYTGGQLDTGSKAEFTYGYYEARINNPGSGGQISNWPAWWLVGTQACWPTDGEIDIFEGFNGNAGYHYGYGSTCNNANWQGSQTSGKDMTGWHVYAVDWQAGSIKYYYDGALVDTIQGVSTTPMELLLDNTTAPQGNVGGPIVVPATMQVDYVRVWQ